MLTLDGRQDLPGSHYSTYRRFDRPLSAVTGAHGMMKSTSAANRSTVKVTQEVQPPHQHMWMVTGPAGCGKSTVAEFLAAELSIPFIEGDDYHPASNREKMSAGTPLADSDRWDWLISLRDAAVKSLCSGTTHPGVVVTCSALKRKYRDVIRVAAYNDHGIQVHFIYLDAPESVLMARVAARQGHFMKSAMVHSQLESLEIPGEEERGRDVISCDCSGDRPQVEALVMNKIHQVLAGDSAAYAQEEEW